MRPALWILLLSTAAQAAPTARVAVASFKQAKADWRGGVTADEAANRLALTDQWAIADREHVRDAEAALGWSGGDDDPQRLTALGKRLESDLVVGGTIDGAKLHVVLVAPAAGKVDKLDVPAAGARPDQLGAALAKALVARDKLDAPALRLTAIERLEDAATDKSYEAYGQARARFHVKDYEGVALVLNHAPPIKMGHAFALLAYAALKLNNLEGASGYAKEALNAAPTDREVRLIAARVEDFRDHVDPAIEAYRGVLEVAPNDAVAQSNLARLLAAKKRDHAAAAKAYEAAVAAEPAWTLPALNLALSRLELGRVGDAVKALERLHQVEPGNTAYAASLARALRRAARPAAAVTLLQPLVAQKPKDVSLRSELALAQAEAGQAADALKTLDGGDASLRLRTTRGRVLLEKGDADGAAKLLDEGHADSAKASVIDRHELGRALAVVQLKRNQPALAVQALRPVVDEDPLDAEAQYDLGLALAATKDPGATAAFEKAVQAAPWLAAPALALARAKLDGGDPAAALAVCKAALAAGAEDPRLHLVLGLAHWRTGATTDALAELKSGADAADPVTQAEAAYDLAELLLATKQPAEARLQAARYLKLETRAGQDERKRRAEAIAR